MQAQRARSTEELSASRKIDGNQRPPSGGPGPSQAPGPSALLSLQRSAGNRAVTSLVQAGQPVHVQRLFGWGKSKKKKPTTAESLDTGFSAMAGEKGSVQLNSLLPFASQIAFLGSKGRLTQAIDDTYVGVDALVREGLKTGVLLSTWSVEKIGEKLNEIGIKGNVPSAEQRKAIDKLSADLGKSSKKDLSATYKALYSRCIQAAAGLTEEKGDNAFQADQGEAGEVTSLRRDIKAVSKISATSFDMAYSERLMKTRDDMIEAYRAQGTKAVETVVLGAGPVGMLAALEAALAGANVHVYEMRRTGPSRSNVLKLTEPTFMKLRKVGVYATLFGPDHTKGDHTESGSHGVSVAYLEDVLRARAAQLGIKITYGYGLEEITAPKDGGTKTTVRLKKYVPTKEGPELTMFKKMGDAPEYIDATSDLVIGATGAGATTGKKLGLGRDTMKDDSGDILQDFTGVGLFEPDHLKAVPPGSDQLEPGVVRWMVGLRTPKVDYLLTQISRENFVKFKNDKSSRDDYISKRGQFAAKFQGPLRESGVFDITLNQAQQFVNEQLGGVVIGDEAATPHPQTGSGFNTGAGSTSLVGGLVRGIGGGERSKAFSSYGQDLKKKTDEMIGKGKGYFKSNAFLKNKPTKGPIDAPEAPKSGPAEEPKTGGPSPFYTPEDIGITPETEFEYQQAQEKVMALYGQGPKGTYEPEDIGITPETDFEYQQAQEKVMALYGQGPKGTYEPEDIGVTSESQTRYDEIAARIESLLGGPKRDYLKDEEQ